MNKGLYIIISILVISVVFLLWDRFQLTNQQSTPQNIEKETEEWIHIGDLKVYNYWYAGVGQSWGSWTTKEEQFVLYVKSVGDQMFYQIKPKYPSSSLPNRPLLVLDNPDYKKEVASSWGEKPWFKHKYKAGEYYLDF